MRGTRTLPAAGEARPVVGAGRRAGAESSLGAGVRLVSIVSWKARDEGQRLESSPRAPPAAAMHDHLCAEERPQSRPMRGRAAELVCVHRRQSRKSEHPYPRRQAARTKKKKRWTPLIDGEGPTCASRPAQGGLDHPVLTATGNPASTPAEIRSPHRVGPHRSSPGKSLIDGGADPRGATAVPRRRPPRHHPRPRRGRAELRLHQEWRDRAEAVVFLDPALGEGFKFVRKRGCSSPRRCAIWPP